MTGQRSPFTISTWVREPLVHFFILGAFIFGAQAWTGDDGRRIEVTAGLKAELARRYQDTHGRLPTPVESAAELSKWERDEALYREGLRRGIERDDPGIRSLVVAKMRDLAGLDVVVPQPSEAALREWLASHRARYELPFRYAFEFIEISGLGESSQKERDRCAAELAEGKAPSTLGRGVTSATLGVDDMKGRMAPEIVAAIPSAPLNEWQRISSIDALYLVRVTARHGGPPAFEKVRAELTQDWAMAERERRTEAAVERVFDMYKTEVRP